MTDKYTFVTVVYNNELGFMRLQARSMARYAASELVGPIIIVENVPAGLSTDWRGKLLNDYGPLQDRVKFVSGSALANLPQRVAGWVSQQVLKLTAAKIIQSRRYLLLDAKNHLIHPLIRSHIEAASGKPRSFVFGYATHPLRPHLEAILHYFALPLDHAQRFLPTTTPFAVDARLALDMMADLERRERRRFENIFCSSPTRFTEFFLLGAYILSKHRKFEDYYDLSGSGYAVIWKEIAASDARISNAIATSEARHAPFFAVHRSALPLLTEPSKQAIASFWQRHGLFATSARARSYLADPNGFDFL